MSLRKVRITRVDGVVQDYHVGSGMEPPEAATEIPDPLPETEPESDPANDVAESYAKFSGTENEEPSPEELKEAEIAGRVAGWVRGQDGGDGIILPHLGLGRKPGTRAHWPYYTAAAAGALVVGSVVPGAAPFAAAFLIAEYGSVLVGETWARVIGRR